MQWTCISTRASRATTVILCLSLLLLIIHVAPGLPSVWSSLSQTVQCSRLQFTSVPVFFHQNDKFIELTALAATCSFQDYTLHEKYVLYSSVGPCILCADQEKHNNNNLPLIMVKTNRSTLHTVAYIPHCMAAMSRRTATTTRFSPEGIGCQKQTAPRFCQQSDQVGLYLASIHQMASPKRGRTHLIIPLLLIYRPRKDERLSWPSWLTCSGRFIHKSGHPSAKYQA